MIKTLAGQPTANLISAACAPKMVRQFVTRRGPGGSQRHLCPSFKARGPGFPTSTLLLCSRLTCAYRESFIFVVAQSEHAFFALAQDQGTTAPVAKRLEYKQMDPFFAAGDNDAP